MINLSAVNKINPVSKTFLIKKGESLNSILNNLEKENLIHSAFFARAYLKLTKLDTVIQAGKFNLSSNQDLNSVIESLKHGTEQVVLTVPEGYRIEQVASKLCQQGLVCAEGYQSLVKTLKINLGEGHFFPDTYFLDKNTSIETLLAKVQENLEVKISSLDLNKKANVLSQKDSFILASLIEREAFSDQERSVIAGILLNRLENGWPLQVDATVQYVAGCQNKPSKIECSNSDWWPKDLNKDDLKIKSPFNTYQNTNLPPTSICNPGFASIKAAFNPQKTDYFYYLHDGQGKIHYAKTLVEHNLNIAKYLDNK